MLEPRQKREFEIVVRTTDVAAAVMLHGEVVGGGTRANVVIEEPKAWVLVEGDKGTKVKPNEVFIDGDTTYKIGMDVRDFVENPEPETTLGYAVYISKGVFQGLWNITGGAVCGIFIGIPRLIGKGYNSLPAAANAYVKAEVELWGAIKDDPVKKALFFNVLTHQTLLAYREAPGLIGDPAELAAKINAAVLAQYTEMWNAWYTGDWRTAVTAFSTEGTERAVDVATALAPGVLARFPAAVEAFKAQKSALYAGVTEDLASYGGRYFSAREALLILKETVQVGYEMTDTNLRRLYGLTLDEALFLRRYAKANDLLIVVRSRAAESVRWAQERAGRPETGVDQDQERRSARREVPRIP